MDKFGHELTYQDFLNHPVWQEDFDTDICEPLIEFGKEASGMEDFYFRAKFITPTGIEFVGWINGEGERLIVLHTKKHDIYLNRYLKKDCYEDLSRYLADNPQHNLTDPQDLFPIEFHTTINMEPYIDWSDTFDFD